ncbi:hypothetical protein ACQP1G_35215 [Nocardia sp. CA-107356]
MGSGGDIDIDVVVVDVSGGGLFDVGEGEVKCGGFGKEVQIALCG